MVLSSRKRPWPNISCSWSKGGSVEDGAIRWERTMWLRGKFVGREVKSDITQFLYILVVAVVGVFEYFSGIPDDAKILSVNV
jgi:hypothetical protein